MYDRKWWPIVPHCFLALNEGTKWWPTFDSKTVFYHKISLVAFFQCMNQRTWCSPGHCCHTITGNFTLFSSSHYHGGRAWVRDRASIPEYRRSYYIVHDAFCEGHTMSNISCQMSSPWCHRVWQSRRWWCSPGRPSGWCPLAPHSRTRAQTSIPGSGKILKSAC